MVLSSQDYDSYAYPFTLLHDPSLLIGFLTFVGLAGDSEPA